MDFKRKKERGTNFTQSETSILVNSIVQYLDIIENKLSDSVTLQQKKIAWQKVTDEFNSSRIEIPRNVNSLKIKYENIKRMLKKKTAAALELGTEYKGREDYEIQLLSRIKFRYDSRSFSEFDATTSDDNVEEILDVLSNEVQSSDSTDMSNIEYVIKQEEDAEEEPSTSGVLERLDGLSDSTINQQKRTNGPTKLINAFDERRNKTMVTELINDSTTNSRLSSISMADTNLLKDTVHNVKRKRIEDFPDILDFPGETMSDLQRKCLLLDIHTKIKTEERQELEWKKKQKLIDLDIREREEKLNILLKEKECAIQKQKIFMEEYQLKIDILKCELNRKLNENL